MTDLPILPGALRRAPLLRGVAGAAMLLAMVAAPAARAAGTPADAAAPETADADGDARSIVVSGQAARTVKMEAPGTTAVLAPEDLVRQPNVSVVDALARVAGISVSPTDFFGTPSSGNHGGLDGAARGGASFVYVRGLSGSYNVNLINGANAAQGMPYSREIQLDLLPRWAWRRWSSARRPRRTWMATRSAARSISAPPRPTISRTVTSA
jgi:outer membrane receptor protein involved in Fe transport